MLNEWVGMPYFICRYTNLTFQTLASSRKRPSLYTGEECDVT